MLPPESDTLATRSSLLSRVRDYEDDGAWGEFDRLYRPLLLRYARHRGLRPDAAEEIAQQCMEAVVKAIPTFEKRTSFRGWLRRIAEHKVCDLLEERGRRSPMDVQEVAEVSDADGPHERLWRREWNHAAVAFLLDTLRCDFPVHTLQSFWMYVVEEVPVLVIARRLGLTANQVYVAKSRVLRRIRECYADLFESLYEVRD